MNLDIQLFDKLQDSLKKMIQNIPQRMGRQLQARYLEKQVSYRTHHGLHLICLYIIIVDKGVLLRKLRDERVLRYTQKKTHEFKELAHHLAGNSREGGYEEEIYEA